MARISLLFSLALVLAIGSVLAHPPTHKKPHKTLCPPTLSKLQSFPYGEVSKFVEKQAQSAPQNIQFKLLFAPCKGFSDFLGGFKYTQADVFHPVHVKFALMTRMLVAAQAHIGVEGELGGRLSKSFAVMAERYGHLVERIAAISAKYKFNANAKISFSERSEIEQAVIKLKGSIRVYVKVITQCSKKFSVGKNLGNPGGFIGVLAQHSLGYADKLIGTGAQGQVGAGVNAGANGKVGGQGEAKVGGKMGGFFGFGAQFDAAGKAHVGGGSGFRPLSNPPKKHLD